MQRINGSLHLVCGCVIDNLFILVSNGFCCRLEGSYAGLHVELNGLARNGIGCVQVLAHECADATMVRVLITYRLLFDLPIGEYMETSIYKAFAERFAAACQADQRIAAACIGGSRGAGTADEHADIDPYVFLYDDTYDAFFAQRHSFVAALGDAVLSEDFNGFGFDMVLFIYANGVEGELVLGRRSEFEQVINGPFKVVVDRLGLLPAHTFPPPPHPDDAEQREHLRWLAHWFWRDLSQLSRCLQRDRIWSAYSHFTMMCETCVRLMRLKHDWTAPLEGMYKLEGAADPEDLAWLQQAICGVERAAIVESTRTLVAFYQRICPPLVAAHGIPYPSRLRDAVLGQFEAATVGV